METPRELNKDGEGTEEGTRQGRGTERMGLKGLSGQAQLALFAQGGQWESGQHSIPWSWGHREGEEPLAAHFPEWVSSCAPPSKKCLSPGGVSPPLFAHPSLGVPVFYPRHVSRLRPPRTGPGKAPETGSWEILPKETRGVTTFPWEAQSGGGDTTPSWRG